MPDSIYSHYYNHFKLSIVYIHECFHVGPQSGETEGTELSYKEELGCKATL